MPTEKPRVIITLPGDLFDRIEDFRYENRYPNRSEAVLALIEEGLKVLHRKESVDGKQNKGVD